MPNERSFTSAARGASAGADDGESVLSSSETQRASLAKRSRARGAARRADESAPVEFADIDGVERDGGGESDGSESEGGLEPARLRGEERDAEIEPFDAAKPAEDSRARDVYGSAAPHHGSAPPNADSSESDAEAAPRVKRARRGESKRQERGGSDKRERILKAAIRVFARKGFYAARVSEIARAAGVADGTIYLYFKNKDDVLISIFEDRITLLIQVLRGEIERPGRFSEKLRRVVEVQLGLFQGQRDLAEVITINLRQSSRLLKQYAAPLFTEYLDVLVSLIAQGQRDGDVRSDAHPWILARALWGAVDGVALTWTLTGGDAAQLQKAAIQIANLFLNGLQADKNGTGSTGLDLPGGLDLTRRGF